MFDVKADRVIDASPEETWKILDDFGGIYRFHPLVERSPLVNGQKTGVGAQRVCHFDDGNSITEEIVEYQAGRGYTVEIIDPGKFPLTKSFGTLALEPAGSGKTKVTFQIRFTPKFGLLGRLMGRAVMVPQFRKIMASVLAGLETHARTGATISRKPLPAAA